MAKKVKLRLEVLLTERKMSRYRLAKLMGTDFQTIDKYYKNTLIRYDSFLLASMCEALNCKIEDLLVLAEELHKKSAELPAPRNIYLGLNL